MKEEITNSDIERTDINRVIKSIDFSESQNLTLNYGHCYSLSLPNISRIVVTTDALFPENNKRIITLSEKAVASITDEKGFTLNLNTTIAEKTIGITSDKTAILFVILATGKRPPERIRYIER